MLKWIDPCLEDDVEALKAALASGTSPYETTQDGLSLLEFAARNSSLKVVRYLAGLASKKEKSSALMLSLFSRNIEVTKALLEAGADFPDDLSDLASYIVSSGDLEIFKLFEERLELHNKHLEIAAIGGGIELFEYLCKKLQVENPDRIAKAAVLGGSLPLLKKAFALGAKADTFLLVKIVNNRDLDFLEEALKYQKDVDSLEVFKSALLFSSKELFQMLLKGLDISLKEAVQSAIKFKNPQAIEAALEMGAPVKLRDLEGFPEVYKAWSKRLKKVKHF